MIALIATHKRKYLFRSLIVLLLLTPMIALITVEALKSYKDDTHEAYLHKRFAASLAATIVKERLDSIMELGVSLANRPAFVKKIEDDNNWTDSIELLKNIFKDFPIIDRIMVFDTNAVIKNMLPLVPGNIGTSRADREWYKKIRVDWKPVLSEVYQRVSKPSLNIVGLAIPIIGFKSAKPLGILLIQIKLENFYLWAQRFEGEESEFISIIDHKGNVVYHPHLDLQKGIVNLSKLEIVSKIMKEKESGKVNGIGDYISPYMKEKAVAGYQSVSKYDWMVIVSQPERLAFVERDRKLTSHLITYGIFIFILATLFFYILHFIAKNEVSNIRESQLLQKAMASKLAQETAAALAEAERKKSSELESLNQQLTTSQDELRSTIMELERFNKIMVGRELDMIKLKEEINNLLELQGKSAKYQIPKAS
ncbi:MAG: cache domain-containing protein [Oligoflexia bacterium]|nr:cache domain-containing protein [Oligoflexia bacterium]